MRNCTEIRKYVTGGAQCAPPGANRVNMLPPRGESTLRLFHLLNYF